MHGVSLALEQSVRGSRRRASILGKLLDADSGDSEVRRQEGIEVT